MSHSPRAHRRVSGLPGVVVCTAGNRKLTEHSRRHRPDVLLAGDRRCAAGRQCTRSTDDRDQASDCDTPRCHVRIPRDVFRRGGICPIRISVGPGDARQRFSLWRDVSVLHGGALRNRLRYCVLVQQLLARSDDSEHQSVLCHRRYPDLSRQIAAFAAGGEGRAQRTCQRRSADGSVESVRFRGADKGADELGKIT